MGFFRFLVVLAMVSCAIGMVGLLISIVIDIIDKEVSK